MAAQTNIYPSNNQESSHFDNYDRNQREFKRITQNPNLLRRLGRNVLTLAAVGTSLLVVGHALDKHNHIKSASTMAQLEAELGHVPAGIMSIKSTDKPDIKEVQYVVQTDPEKKFVSSVAADMHPIAPNQDPQSEFSAIESYTGTDNLSTGEEIDMLVDTDQGVILPNPNPSVENKG